MSSAVGYRRHGSKAATPDSAAARERVTRQQSRVHLDALVEEAIVDCYNEDEQITGLFTMLEDNLVVPFQVQVLGVAATVESVDLIASGQIVAICSRDQVRQSIPMLDLPLPTPLPEGAEWIAAYRHWHSAAHGE
jgi:hypothetical protein